VGSPTLTELKVSIIHTNRTSVLMVYRTEIVKVVEDLKEKLERKNDE